MYPGFSLCSNPGLELANAFGVNPNCIINSTPKAFANFSPVVGAQRQPWDIISNRDQTLKGFAGRQTLSGFNHSICLCTPGFSLRSNPGLELANAFGVNSKCIINSKLHRSNCIMTGILVVRQFESTPKAFANFSPAVGAQRQPWDIISNRDQTLKGFAGCLTLSGFNHSICYVPQGSRYARTLGWN